MKKEMRREKKNGFKKVTLRWNRKIPETLSQRRALRGSFKLGDQIRRNFNIWGFFTKFIKKDQF
jgi:hypothetical protein